jgi:TPR repeat protein
VGFFGKQNKRIDFNHIDKDTPISVEDIGVLLSKDQQNFRKILEGADNGNLQCQIFVSNWGLHLIMQNEEEASLPANKLESVYKLFERFTKLAAEQGHSDSQYNLAKFYLLQWDVSKGTINEEEFAAVKKAKYWYEQAQQNGYQDLEDTIANLSEVLALQQ